MRAALISSLIALEDPIVDQRALSSSMAISLHLAISSLSLSNISISFCKWSVGESNSRLLAVCKEIINPLIFVEHSGYDPLTRLCKSRVLPIKTNAPRCFMKRNCDFCQNEYDAQERYLKRGQGRFCSRSCSSKNRCQNSAPKLPNLNCHTCKVPFYRSKSKMETSKSGLQFCSRKCKDFAQSLKGGERRIQPSHYGTASVPDYSFARKQFCEGCGFNQTPEILQVHHLDKDRGNNSPENLICFCPNCHDEWHFKDKSGRFAGWFQ